MSGTGIAYAAPSRASDLPTRTCFATVYDATSTGICCYLPYRAMKQDSYMFGGNEVRQLWAYACLGTNASTANRCLRLS
eukprot:20486-Rhodomonas_salina.5